MKIFYVVKINRFGFLFYFLNWQIFNDIVKEKYPYCSKKNYDKLFLKRNFNFPPLHAPFQILTFQWSFWGDLQCWKN
jgi:hypothetical protein